MNPKQFFVYILASKPFGTLYIGVTSDLNPTRSGAQNQSSPRLCRTLWHRPAGLV
jgi:predicted GIY-YIG superfamily endonuclease